MHLLAEANVHINRPVAAVFDYVTNLERFGEWFPGVLNIESRSAQSHAEPGKEYLETVAIPLRGRRKVKVVVREVAPEQRFVTEGSLAPLWPRMEIHFAQHGPDACHITWHMFSRNTTTLFSLTLLPLARCVIRQRAGIGLMQLKQRLEQAC